jgi:hypothetical protein
VTVDTLKLMVVIVDKKYIDRVEAVLQDEFVRFQYVSAGVGTANSELLDIMGIGSAEKNIVFCLQPNFRVPYLMETVSDRVGFHQRGRGIAFSIPLSGIGSPAAHMLTEEQLLQLTERLEPRKRELALGLYKHQAERVHNEMETAQYDLIVSVINCGYTDDLMDKAKEAGATGGTILKTRRIGIEDSIKFFGISVHAEKEMVAILTARSHKNAIMTAINQDFGLNSEAKGIVFSLPVDSVAPEIMK